MLLKQLIQENTLLPKKVLAVVLVRFFKDLHFGIQEMTKELVEGFGNELNFDVSDPEMRGMLDFPGRNLKPPIKELRAMMNGLAKKYKVNSFKPQMTFEKDAPFEWWVTIRFTEPLGLDDAALDAAWEEVKKLGLDGNVTTDGLTNSLTVNG